MTFTGWRREDFSFKSCSYSWRNWSWGENQLKWCFEYIYFINFGSPFFLFWVYQFVHSHNIVSWFHLIGTFSQMFSERQRKESAPPVFLSENASGKTMFFLAEVCYTYLSILHFFSSMYNMIPGSYSFLYDIHIIYLDKTKQKDIS